MMIVLTPGLIVRGEERDLVIDRLVYDDEGSYECRAVNKISRQAQETRSNLIQVIPSPPFFLFHPPFLF